MGLDLYLKRLKKPNIDTNKVYKPHELRDSGLTIVSVKDNKVEKVFSQDIIDNFTQTVQVEYNYQDNHKLFKLFKEKYPDKYSDIENYFDDVPNGMRKDNCVFDPCNSLQETDKNGTKYKFVDYGIDYPNPNLSFNDLPSVVVTVLKEKDLEKFTSTTIEPTYALKSENLDYQRKGINLKGWDLLPENSTYCTNKKVVEELVKKGGLHGGFLENWIDGETALIAWW